MSARGPYDYVGRPVPRLEDLPLLRGQGSFVDDVDRPGQLHARVVRSHVAHGRILGIDDEECRRRPEVAAVLTAVDLPPGMRIPLRLGGGELAERALQPPLARDVVRYVGEPVAVVVAESPYAAEDAAASVWVETAELPALADVAEAAGAATLVHDAVPGNVLEPVHARLGPDVDGIFERAEIVVAEELAIHRHTAVPLETRGLVAEFDTGRRLLTVWGPTKVKHFNRRVLAGLLGLPEASVRFVEPDVGGGFGTRGEFYPEDLLIPWLAVATGRPVKWVEDRYEHFVAANHSREQQCRIEVAAAADGRLLAFRAAIRVDLGAYVRTNGTILVTNTVTHLPGPYRWDAFDVEAVGVLTNKTPAGTYRGPGQYEAALHRERMLDLVARRAGIDPAVLRRQNLVRPEEMPYTFAPEGLADPIVYDSGDFPLLWDRLLGSVPNRTRAQVAQRREAGELVGIGTAAFVEVGPRGPYESAQVVPEPDGRFTVRVGIASLGQGVATALAQIAAETLRVPLEAVAVEYRDTDLVAEGEGAFSSRSVVFGGNAVAGAARDLVERARLAGAASLGVTPEEVEVEDGRVRARARPERAVPIAELGCRGEYRYEKAGRSFSMGGALALVEVDPDTGAPSVLRCVVACDVGRAVNPLVVEGQVVGAAVQGLAGALFENLPFDGDGQPLATSFVDYWMPTAADVPTVDAVVLELQRQGPGAANPLAVKGAGEAGIVGVGAALANAVADALGGRDTVLARLPLLPETVRLLGGGATVAV